VNSNSSAWLRTCLLIFRSQQQAGAVSIFQAVTFAADSVDRPRAKGLGPKVLAELATIVPPEMLLPRR